MNNYPFESLISPVTGRVVSNLNYILIGDREEIATPSPKFLDLQIDVQDLIENKNIASQANVILGTSESAAFPNAQVLKNLNNGILKQSAGILAQAIADTDYLSTSLQNSYLFTGDTNNKVSKVQQIQLLNMPTLGLTTVGLLQGKIYRGTFSGIPTTSDSLSILEDTVGGLTTSVANLYSYNYITGSTNLSLPNSQSLSSITNGMLKHTGPVLQYATPSSVNNAVYDYLDRVPLNIGYVAIGDGNGYLAGYATIDMQNLPALTQDNVYAGNVNGRPVATPLSNIYQKFNIGVGNLLIGGNNGYATTTATITYDNFPAGTANYLFSWGANSRPVQIKQITIDNLFNIPHNQLITGGYDNIPVLVDKIQLSNLPQVNNAYAILQATGVNNTFQESNALTAQFITMAATGANLPNAKSLAGLGNGILSKQGNDIVIAQVAPTDATYILHTPNASLPNAQALSALNNQGLLKLVVPLIGNNNIQIARGGVNIGADDYVRPQDHQNERAERIAAEDAITAELEAQIAAMAGTQTITALATILGFAGLVAGGTTYGEYLKGLLLNVRNNWYSTDVNDEGHNAVGDFEFRFWAGYSTEDRGHGTIWFDSRGRDVTHPDSHAEAGIRIFSWDSGGDHIGSDDPLSPVHIGLFGYQNKYNVLVRPTPTYAGFIWSIPEYYDTPDVSSSASNYRYPKRSGFYYVEREISNSVINHYGWNTKTTIFEFDKDSINFNNKQIYNIRDPQGATEATNKSWVESKIAAIPNLVTLAGDVTGSGNVGSTITTTLASQSLSKWTAPTQNLSMSNYKITNLGAGTVGSNDAARMVDLTNGTVTSITGKVSGNGILINNGVSDVTITSTGNFTYSLNTELQGLSNLMSNGIVVRTSTGTYTTRGIQGTSGQIIATNNYGIAGDTTLSLATTVTGATITNPSSITYDSYGRITGASSGTAPVISVSGTSGQINSTGGTTPTLSLFTTGVTAGSYTLSTITVDSYGRITSASNGSSGGTGTVTSVAVTGSTGLSVSGSPITTNGTIGLTLGTELQALNNLSGTGLVTRTGTGTYANRSITSTGGTVNITNGNGVSNNINLDLPNTGVTPGFYTGVTVNNNGLVTWGVPIDLILSGHVIGTKTLNNASNTITTQLNSTLDISAFDVLTLLSTNNLLGLVLKCGASGASNPYLSFINSGSDHRYYFQRVSNNTSFGKLGLYRNNGTNNYTILECLDNTSGSQNDNGRIQISAQTEFYNTVYIDSNNGLTTSANTYLSFQGSATFNKTVKFQGSDYTFFAGQDARALVRWQTAVYYQYQPGLNLGFTSNNPCQALEFWAISSKKVKDIIEDDKDKVLELSVDLMKKLKFVQYEYKDKIQKGYNKYVGVIAEDIKEVDEAYFLNKQEFIPNIYDYASICAIDDETYILTLDNDLKEELKAGSELKIQHKKTIICTIKEIQSSNQIIIKAENGICEYADEVFVFGTYEDCPNVDKTKLLEALAPVIRHNYEEIEQLKLSIANLQAQVNNFRLC